MRAGVNPGESEVDTVALGLFEQAGDSGHPGVIDEERFFEVDQEGVRQGSFCGGFDEEALTRLLEGVGVGEKDGVQRRCRGLVPQSR